MLAAQLGAVSSKPDDQSSPMFDAMAHGEEQTFVPIARATDMLAFRELRHGLMQPTQAD